VALLVACVTLPPLTAASCGDEPSGVTLGTATRGPVAEIVEASGSVTARAAATVSSPADGTLAELRFGAGDRVRKGQVVAVIDSPTAQRRLDAAARALDAAATGGVPAAGGTAGFAAVQRRTDARADEAFTAAREAAGRVTDADLKAALLAQVKAAQQQYRAASETAAAAVRSVRRGVAELAGAVDALSAAQRLQAQQAYDLAEAAVDALTVRAPCAGIVQLGGTPAGGKTSLNDLLSSGTGSGAAPAPLNGVDPAVPVGAVVAAGTPILTIVDTGQLGLTAEVDETDVLLVEPGGKATAELDAAVGASYAATVRAIDLLPTTSARGGVSYRVRLALGRGDYADGRTAPTPRPGMSAILRLEVRHADDAVVVPANAIVSADGRDAIWAVRGGRAERVPVTLGVQGEDVVQILSGIDAGGRLVVAGTDQVSPGQSLP
jgi:multidrug efflux pump subunit AcrA (membrane-fusion protein)